MEEVQEAHVSPAVNRVVADKARRDRGWEIIRDTLDRLIGASDNDEVEEYEVLGRIAVRAGLMWRCVDSDCAAVNHMNCTGCDVCGKRKPKDREVPQADGWA